MAGEVFGDLQNGKLVARLAHRDFVPGIDLERRDVHLPAVHRDVAVTDELPGLTPRHRESEAVDDVVEPALQLLEQHLAGDALGAGGAFEIVAELLFLGEVDALRLLLLAKLQAVAHDFRLAVLAMLAGGEIAFFDSALFAVAAFTLQIKLHAL